jgi:membrane protease YdiL (CAAX protease family)
MSEPIKWRSRVGALLEVLGVFVTGTVTARTIVRAAGLSSGSIRDTPPGASIDYMALASARAVTLLVQYGIILGLAFLIGWWHRRRRISIYGVSTAALSVRTHLTIALVLFSVGGLLPKLLIFAKDHISLGQAPRHWELIASPSSVDFWVYMAVASFGLVPIVEELFFRGYVQTRLAEAFGAPAAIIMTALLFTLSHRQYFIPSVLGVGMLLSTFLGSTFTGYVRHCYRSLVPGTIAHALGNIPVRGWAQVLLLASMMLVIVATHRAILIHIRELIRFVRTRTVLSGSVVAVSAITAVLTVAAASPAALLPVSVVALLVALAIEWFERQHSAETSVRPGAG